MIGTTPRSAVSAGCLLLALSTITGCGGGSDQLDVYPTQGKLLLDGEPFGPTSIMLVPAGAVEKDKTHSAVGQVDESGKIQFTTYDVGDGVPAGEYRVAVGLVMAAPPRPFPAVYRNATESPLTVTIEPKDMNELTIEMESRGGPMAGAPSFGRGPDMGKAVSDPAFSAGAPKNGEN